MKIVSLVFIAALLISFGFTLINKKVKKSNSQTSALRAPAFEQGLSAEQYMRLASWD